ncbi:uncharacterized protein FPRN_03634 [Fusarium proliferatum]|nr:uncharacterized protein FPRN_03634 [Fusarium proliferatum]
MHFRLERLSRLFSKGGNGNGELAGASSNGPEALSEPAPIDLKNKQSRSQRSASHPNAGNIGHSETVGTSDDVQSPCGIRELVSQSNENPNCIDFVAIHGLNGHRDKTWIDKSTRLNWLEDRECLQKDFPAARVLTFGYNSRTYFSRSTSDVRDFSSELLAALKAWRSSTAEQSRPLIFICHSLGGLVFKQAVIHAHEQNHHYSSILDNILGVLFFATPHRGSDLAFWDDIGTTLVRMSTLGHSTNTKLSRDLRVNGILLKSISDSFVHRGGRFKIRSFYETQQMQNLHCEVVRKDSAILGWPNELAIAASAHHSNICKFPSPSDQRYRNTVSAIQEVIGGLKEGAAMPEDQLQQQSLHEHQEFTRREAECLRALNSHYEGHLAQVEDPVPGTCEWVLCHEKWRQWDSLLTPALLWITADAGCGKSVLAKFLAEHLLSQRGSYPRRDIFHFFFKEGLENQDNASKAVSALLHQLCCSQRHIIEHVVEKYTSTPTRLFNQFSYLSAILMTILKDPRTRDIIWVLDGLDECDRQSLEQLIKFIATYFDSQSTTKGLRSSACCFKMVILSRPHNLIQQKLHLRREEDHLDTNQEPNVKVHNKIRLVAEEETAAIAKDTTLFVRSKIIELRENSDLFPEVLHRLEERLINGADFTFLWISLVIKLVEDTEVDGISMAQLESILNTTSLDAVYERFLSGRPLPLKARKALMLVLAAVRPLTLRELCAAIEIRQDHLPQTSDDAQARERLENYKLDENSLGRRVKIGESSISKELGIQGLGSNSRDKKIKTNHTAKGRNTKLDKSDVPMAGSHSSAKISSLSNLKEVLRKPFSNHLRQICGHFLRIRGREVFLVHQTAREFLLGRYNTAIPETPVLRAGGYNKSFRDHMTRIPMDTSVDMQVSIGTLSHQGWRHSIKLADANRYLLQICADYIELFAFERVGGRTRWTNKDAITYLMECRDDPPRAFFKYAAFHWIDHYRPIRQSFDFSFDYLLKPSEQHFKVWIIFHRSWMPEEERHQLEAGGIPIPNGLAEGKESGVKPRIKWSKDSMHERALNKADKRAADFEGVLEHFHLNPETETETYRSQYLDGDQYWKRDEDHQLKSVDSDDGDRIGGEEDDTVEDVKTAGIENWKIPDRVQFFWRQNRREVLETLEEVSNPFSPTGGNPRSYFTAGTGVLEKFLRQANALYLPQNVIVSYPPETGRTTALAFALLSRMYYLSTTQPQSLAIVPTRESLICHMEKYIKEIGRFCKTLVTETITVSGKLIAKVKANVIIATPGNLLDCIRRRLVDTSQVRLLLVDDVDYLVDSQELGQQCITVARAVPQTIQLLLFFDQSTSTSGLIHNMLKYSTREKHELNANKIVNLLFRCSGEQEKLDIFCKLPGVVTISMLIIFVQEKASGQDIYHVLTNEGHAVTNLFDTTDDGGMQRLLEKFMTGQEKVLITKDCKTRGLNLPSSSMVINYDVPDAASCRYIRQASRAGKAGRFGFAVNLVSNEKELEDLQSGATS